MDVVGLAQSIYSIATLIHAQVELVKANKEQCQRLSRRIGDTVGSIKKITCAQRNRRF